MQKNHIIENDVHANDHLQLNVIDINVRDHDHDHDHVLDIIIDRNIIDIVDHDHHDENVVHVHVHLDVVRVQLHMFLPLESNHE